MLMDSALYFDGLTFSLQISRLLVLGELTAEICPQWSPVDLFCKMNG